MLTPEQKDNLARKIDPHKLCEFLQIEITSDSGSQIRSACPIHKGDNPTAFSIDYCSGKSTPPTWYCRSRCNEGNDMYELISRMYGCSFIQSVSWIAKFCGVDNFLNMAKSDPVSYYKYYIDKEESLERTQIKKITPRKINSEDSTCPDINEKFVEFCVDNRSFFGAKYLSNRAFDDSVLDIFDVGYAPAGSGICTCKDGFNEWSEDRISVPLRDIHGKLVGISGRTLYETKFQKYKILHGSQKKEHLYGLSFALPYINKRQSVMVVEGFTDVWRCHQYGFKNVVAIMGKDMSKEQIMLLVSLVDTVAIAFDGDEAGTRATAKLSDKLSQYLNVYLFGCPKNRDVGELSEGEFFSLCRAAPKV